MQHRKFPLAVAGGVFWAVADGIEQEEQGRHPWIILSYSDVMDATGIVIAVPMTSNPTQYRSTEVYVDALGLRPRDDVKEPLRDGMSGIVKCHKLRHWSVARVAEIIGDIDPVGLEKLRGVASDTFGRKRAGRG